MLNAFIGNTKESHLQVGGAEIKSGTLEGAHRGSRSEVPLCSQPVQIVYGVRRSQQRPS